MFKYFLVLCALTISTVAQAAEQPKVIGEYGDWVALTYNDRGNTICYMSSTPKKDEGKYTRRGDIYTIITHRPAEKSYDEVTFVAGYTFNTKAPLTVKIGNQTFNATFTEGDKGWMRTTDEDAKIIVAGDFNDYVKNQPLRYLADNGLHSVSENAQGRNGARGTYCYHGDWSSLDHILASPAMYRRVEECFIYDAPYLLTDDEQYGGRKPARTFLGPRYLGGTSDHLPLVARFSIGKEQ